MSTATTGRQKVRRNDGITVKVVRCHPFGDMLDFDMPPGTDVVIVCINDGMGLQPVRVLLPHQVYTRTIRDLLREYPATRTITVIPVTASLYIDVWGNHPSIPHWRRRAKGGTQT